MTLQPFFKVTALLGILTLSACSGNDAAKTESSAATAEHKASEEVYSCPMHPEVTGKAGDKCPKCGMALELNKNAGNTNAYFMQYSSQPAELTQNTEAVLAFTPKIKGKESEAVPLDVQHDRKLHLIIVSNDLRYFDHVHPEYQADGSYQVKVLGNEQAFTNGRGHSETKFEEGGDYLMYADYLPSGASHQVEKMAVHVAGTPYKSTTYTSANLVARQDNYSMELIPEGGHLHSGTSIHLMAVVRKDGKELDAATFENYLGAKAHMVVLGLEDKDFLHVHPEVVKGKFDLHTTFAKPGIYRGWIQINPDGKVRTFDFTILAHTAHNE